MKNTSITLLIVCFLCNAVMFKLDWYHKCIHKSTHVILRWYPIASYHILDQYTIKGSIDNEAIMEKTDNIISYYPNSCIHNIMDNFYGEFIFAIASDACKSKTIKMEFTKDGLKTPLSFKILDLKECVNTGGVISIQDGINYDTMISPEISAFFSPFKTLADNYDIFYQSLYEAVLTTYSYDQDTLTPATVGALLAVDSVDDKRKLSIKVDALALKTHIVIKIAMKKPTRLFTSQAGIITKKVLTIHDYRLIPIVAHTDPISHLSQIRSYHLPAVELKVYSIKELIVEKVVLSATGSSDIDLTVTNNAFTLDITTSCNKPISLKISFQYLTNNHVHTESLTPTCGNSKEKYVEDQINVKSTSKNNDKLNVVLEVDKTTLINQIKVELFSTGTVDSVSSQIAAVSQENRYQQSSAAEKQEVTVEVDNSFDADTLKISGSFDGTQYFTSSASPTILKPSP